MADEDNDDIIVEDVGGVQGSEEEPSGPTDAGAAPDLAEEPADSPAPDAGEIEWAGALVKKPPSPSN